MLHFDKTTKQIQINRGDSASMNVTAKDSEGNQYKFQPTDTVKFKVAESKNEPNVVIEKAVEIVEEVTSVIIPITSEDTKIGDYINKPVIYWYEISVESPGGEVQTIIGYDKDGPKEFVLNPEAGNKEVETGDLND